ncbi:MAG: glycoside hydrolase family 97 protein [Bacteroidales bacterium]|nr:glycoside hydrolase family 97 protein [Bacteroidales bacterium]
MRKIFLAIALALCSAAASAAPKYGLTSPDGTIKVDVSVSPELSYSVSIDGKTILQPSALSMTLSDGTVWGGGAKPSKARQNRVDRIVEARIYSKSSIPEKYNELELSYKGYKVIFRAYDNGVAYRFVSLSKKDFKVASEKAEYSFLPGSSAYVPYVDQNLDGDFDNQLHNSFENQYAYQKLAAWKTDRLAFLPLMVEAEGGVKMCISEADLLSYPGMFLYNGDSDDSLEGYFPKYPTSKAPKGDGRSLYVETTADYIAQCKAGCTFPWRLMGISRNDWEMTENDLVYLLASPADPKADYSWVEPGKVAWDWWNNWNIYGVDFESGVNNDTYKYYIDFASKNGIEYVIMDEGWSVGFEDLFHIVPEIDLQALVDYGKERNVGIILWAGYTPFQKDIEKACKVYSEMGVKGFKVDFMDSCDQPVVEFHRTAAEIAAKYHLMVDFHGTYKPTGLHRTYPNVINFEGIYGLEQLKWNAKADQVPYDVTLPFIRFFAGPADYTQGAMRNATKSNFRAVYDEAMSQGTRCHQLAEYVVFSSPLNMLCDNPSNYMAEPECTKYIAEVPEIWDETKALAGKVGEYVAIARRSGNTWYVGVLGNWDERDVELDLGFLPEGDYKAEIFRDGVNANKVARDFKRVEETLPADRKLAAHLAPGGGYVAIITRT